MKLLLLAATVLLGGCHMWYKPVPVENAIGETEAVIDGDTLNVHRERRFEIYAGNPEVTYDGYEQLNRAYRAFERHFTSPAPRLAVFLFPDTVDPLDAGTVKSFNDRGFTIVEYARPRSVRAARRYNRLDYGGVDWPIAPTAARVMLARFAEAQVGPTAEGLSDDQLLQRFPFWYRTAVYHLIGESGAIENDLEIVRERRHQWLPIKDLIVLVKPASADSLLDPSRRSEADEITQILSAQAATFGRFLVEREGAAVLGRLARGYLSGRPIAEMVAEFHSTPRRIEDLEQAWRTWVDTRAN